MKHVHPKLSAKGVNKVFAPKAQAVLNDVSGHGYDIRPTQVLRSRTEQRKLYAKGRTNAQLKKAGFTDDEISKYRKAKSLATDARVTNVLMSKHIEGTAMDVAFYDDNGKPIWNTEYEGWAIYGLACKAHKLTWGGTWKMKDLPHCELSGKSKT